MKKLFLIIFFSIPTGNSLGFSIIENYDSSYSSTINISSNHVNYQKVALISGAVLGAGTGVYYYQLNAWWKHWRKPFHIQEDLVYGKSVDKIGHAWDGALINFILSKSYRWAGLSEESSHWVGTIGASLFLTFVEIQDGRSQWGFDRVDAAANIAGSFYPLLQYYVPDLKNISLKASYFPRQYGKAGNIPGQIHTPIDDYEGQTFWLSIKAGKIFPKIFPNFLNLSVGYSVRNLKDQSNQYGILLLAPDFDFSDIIPQHSEFLKTISEGLNYFKFPTPAIQISPKVIWFGLYY